MQIASTDTWLSHTQSFSGQNGSSNAGSASNPYIIDTPGKLARIAYNVSNGTSYSGSYFKQTAYINIGGYDWAPIGKKSGTYFSGTYDGNGYKISGMYLAQDVYVGLFGCIASNATIKNVNLTNSYTLGGGTSGTLVGYAYGTIDSCTVDCTINTLGWCCGGIVGGTSGATIKNCVSFSTLVAEETEYTSDNISAIGGIVGCIDGNCLITDCAFYGKIETSSIAGGISGEIRGDNNRIEKCIVDTTMFANTPNSYLGGILGHVLSNAGSFSIKNCDIKTGFFSTASSFNYCYSGGVIGASDTYSTITITACSAETLSYIGSRSYCFFHSALGQISVNACMAQLNNLKIYTSYSNWATYWAVVTNINGGLPIQKELYAPAAVATTTHSSIISTLTSKGYSVGTNASA